jgi:NAD(P)-dependent dehydrogenase (short-subunit alcohol dehydrogenase family)
MARVFVTGSADGLGRHAARDLAAAGHEVLLHARSEARAEEAIAAVPTALGVAVGDLASLRETCALAEAVNDHGRFDAVIHNAGIGYRERREGTEDGLEHVFQINVLAPYVLTALITAPDRLVYLSSGLHRSGEVALDDLDFTRRRWSGMRAYSDSKLLDVLLAFAVARHRPSTTSNAVEPGWVATKMGGPGAPDDFQQGVDTQVWLATSPEAAHITGRYFFHLQEQPTSWAAHDERLQEALLDRCAELSGVDLPAA